MAGNISNVGRILTGVVAGVLVIANKVISQGASTVIAALKEMSRNSDGIFELIGYTAIAFCIILLSAGIAWAVTEQNRFKLVAIAVSAPALVSAWGSGQGLQRLSLISSAYAQTSGTTPAKAEGFWKGVRLFFDGVPGGQTYSVVVDSAKNPKDAAALADLLSRQNPNWEVAVADPVRGQGYFAVTVGTSLSYKEAMARLQEVRAKPLGANAYLSLQRSTILP